MKFVDPLIPQGSDVERLRQGMFDIERRRPGIPTFQVKGGANTIGVFDYLEVEGGGVASVGTNQNRVSLSPGYDNLLINGSFYINQRAPATNADDTYAHDRWYALTQSNPVAVTTVLNAEDTTPYAAAIVQTNASAQRVGYAQIIESINCIHLRGRPVTFQFRSLLSAAGNVRYAILEWTGTADTVTSDVVNDWTSTTYTAGNFFNSTTLTVSGVGSYALTAGATVDKLTVTLGSSFTNLIVIVWSESALAQNDYLLIAKAKLEPGSSASPYWARPISVELALCQRYYWKSFSQGVAPAQATGDYTGSMIYVSSLGAGALQGASAKLPVTMRAAPTITTYSPAAASANWYNVTALAASGAATTAPAGIASGEHIYLFNTQTGTDAAGQFFSIHATAAAEL